MLTSGVRICHLCHHIYFRHSATSYSPILMTIYPASVYSIGTGYTIALILGAYFSDGYFLDKIPELSQKPRLMALLYLGGSIICLVR